MIIPNKPIDVAVGVLVRPDGSFLLAQRPPGKAMAGYWEFPGGKVEFGEAPFDALKRELIEELGMTILDAHPWAQRVVVYPHATVRLHFFRVYLWDGEPVAHEGQEFRWEHLNALTTDPWLPGALPLKRWLALPSTYAISNAQEVGIAIFLRNLDAKLASGSIRMLQLREKELDAKSFAMLFSHVFARTRAHGVRLLINSAHPPRYWVLADGVHCTSTTLMKLDVKPLSGWCGASCHDALDLERAADLGFDFAVLGPVKSTASHPRSHPLGWENFMHIAQKTRIPIYAIGGLSWRDYATARSHGAQGIAAIRSIWR